MSDARVSCEAMAGRRTAFVVHPSERDRLNTRGRDHGAAVDLVWFEEDDPSPVRLLERAERDPRFAEVDGVFGSADASAHLAVRLAATRGLPGPTPEAFMRCHDKLASRRHQRELVPEATPRFFAIDPAHPLPSALPLPFPLFVKPVAAHLSQMAYEVHDRHGLERVLTLARDQLDAIAAFDERLEGRSFHLMLAEELLTGRLVTFEAYMHLGEMTPIGVTDSVMHPNGISFLRFEYPSELPPRDPGRDWPTSPLG